MMKKSECEPIIRRLCHDWREELDHPLPDGATLYSFSDFKVWLRGKHYSSYLDFRSSGGAAGADAAAEHWFNQEMKQAWRD
jgi:hypothetical protein